MSQDYVSSLDFRVETVERDNLDNWLAFMTADVEKRRAAVRDHMVEVPQLQRFVLLDSEGPIVRWMTEPTDAGLSIFAVVVMREAAPERKSSGLTHTAERLARLIGPKPPCYIETTLRHEYSFEPQWEAALLTSGFRPVGEKRLWTLDIAEGCSGLMIDAPHLSVHDRTSPAHEALFAEIVADSLDREQLLERHFGVAINEFDWMLSAERDGQLVGIGVFQKSGSDQGGWIKYIGIRPGYTGRGIASQIMNEGISEFGRRGIKKVLALIDEVNTPSIKLHKRFGFMPEPKTARSFYLLHDVFAHLYRQLPAVGPVSR
jgi:RimJ/RimL family protein N-acetyltransferase